MKRTATSAGSEVVSRLVPAAANARGGLMRTVTAVLLLTLSMPECMSAQDTPKLDAATRQKLRQAAVDLSAAMKAEDEAAVKRVAKRSVALLGDQAGLPEAADEFRPVPTRTPSRSPRTNWLPLSTRTSATSGDRSGGRWTSTRRRPATPFGRSPQSSRSASPPAGPGRPSPTNCSRSPQTPGTSSCGLRSVRGPACSRSRRCGRARADRSRWPSGSTSKPRRTASSVGSSRTVRRSRTSTTGGPVRQRSGRGRPGAAVRGHEG